MRLELTAVFREAPEGGYTAFVKEMPAAISEVRRWRRRARTWKTPCAC
jgi:hypothetical protein